VTTHTHYNFLANRFYEALNYGTVVLFDKTCLGTLEKSGYTGFKPYVIDGVDDLTKALSANLELHSEWLQVAREEKISVIKQIADIVGAPANLENLKLTKSIDVVDYDTGW
jgi:hypothetical protein